MTIGWPLEWLERQTQKKAGLTVIPFKHFGWHSGCLYTAHAFVWIGFWIAVYQAWRARDVILMAYPLMMLGVGLLIFRGVAFLMNVWVNLAAYISMREIGQGDDFTPPVP